MCIWHMARFSQKERKLSLWVTQFQANGQTKETGF